MRVESKANDRLGQAGVWGPGTLVHHTKSNDILLCSLSLRQMLRLL